MDTPSISSTASGQKYTTGIVWELILPPTGSLYVVDNKNAPQQKCFVHVFYHPAVPLHIKKLFCSN